MPVDLTKPPYIVYYDENDIRRPVFYMVDEPIMPEHLEALVAGKTRIIKRINDVEYGAMYLAGTARKHPDTGKITIDWQDVESAYASRMNRSPESTAP